MLAASQASLHVALLAVDVNPVVDDALPPDAVDAELPLDEVTAVVAVVVVVVVAACFDDPLLHAQSSTKATRPTRLIGAVYYPRRGHSDRPVACWAGVGWWPEQRGRTVHR